MKSFMSLSTALLLTVSCYAQPSPSPTSNSFQQSTSAVRRVGPPPHLIREWPGTVTNTQPKERIIPNARVLHQTGTNRILSVEFFPDTSMTGATTPREVAEQFLSTYHELLGLESDLKDLSFVDVNISSGITHNFRYQQIYGGLPVKFGQLGVIVKNDLSLNSASLGIQAISVPQPAEPFNPTNAERAKQIALRTINAHWIPNSNPVARAEILVSDGQPLVVWTVRFSSNGGLQKTLPTVPKEHWQAYFDMMSWEVIIDANTLLPVAALYTATDS